MKGVCDSLPSQCESALINGSFEIEPMTGPGPSKQYFFFAVQSGTGHDGSYFRGEMDAITPFDGVRAGKIYNSAVGAYDFEVQLYERTNLNAGERYKLSFYVMKDPSSSNCTATLKVMQDESPWDFGGLDEFVTISSTQWKKKEYEFYATGENYQYHRISLMVGLCEGVIYVDNFQMQQVTSCEPE